MKIIDFSTNLKQCARKVSSYPNMNRVFKQYLYARTNMVLREISATVIRSLDNSAVIIKVRW